jgi:hypothetical protein
LTLALPTGGLFQILGIKVVVEGSAKTHFRKCNTYYDTTQRVMKDKQYITVFTSSDDGKLPAGKYRFGFSFLIPPYVPASFKLDGVNYIEYLVRAELVIAWRLNKTDHVFFQVDRRDDLNFLSSYRAPCVRKVEATNRNFTMTVSIPYIVFTPGSRVPISILIDNNGSKPVGVIGMKLFRKIVKEG